MIPCSATREAYFSEVCVFRRLFSKIVKSRVLRVWKSVKKCGNFKASFPLLEKSMEFCPSCHILQSFQAHNTVRFLSLSFQFESWKKWKLVWKKVGQVLNFGTKILYESCKSRSALMPPRKTCLAPMDSFKFPPTSKFCAMVFVPSCSSIFERKEALFRIFDATKTVCEFTQT